MRWAPRTRGAREKRRVPGTPRRGLEPLPGRPAADRDAFEMIRHGQALAEPRHEVGVGLGLGAKPVVDVERRGGTGAGAGRARRGDRSRATESAPPETATKTVSPPASIAWRRMVRATRVARLVSVITFRLQAHPDLPVLEVFLLPDRHGPLERVDGEAAGLEGLAAGAGEETAIRRSTRRSRAVRPDGGSPPAVTPGQRARSSARSPASWPRPSARGPRTRGT